MKKIAVILASILAAVSFSSCNKEIAPETAAPAAGQKIVLNLGAATKTTYEGNTTTWNAEDEISVFICKHGTKESASWTNYKFVCEDAAAGKFSCEIDGLSATEDYDMFAFYPYFENWTKPDSIGFNIAYNQKIEGIDGKSGAKAQPLWGAQTTGQKINALSMNMKQGATFFKFGIEANDDITISSITMTAPEGIYPGTSMVVNAFDGSVTDGRYKQSSVTATVTGGIIEAGERGEFTMLVRPFALTSGQKLECVIATADGQKMTFELTAPAAGYNFEAGKVNTIERTFAADPEKAVSLPYSESFASDLGDFTIKDVTIPTGMSWAWQWNSNKYAKASAYVSNTSYAAESWLVSPLLDLSGETHAYLTFTYAMNKGANDEYADNFYLLVIDGTNETRVAVPDLPSNQTWTFYDTEIDLSAFCGKNVKIAFVYNSTTTSAPTVEIKNVKVSNTSSTAGGSTDPVTPPADGSLTPAANEVLHLLSNDEIKAKTYGSYSDVTITSAGGNWTGNIIISQSNNNYYIQFRNKTGSYLKSPVYSSNVKRIVIVASTAKMDATTNQPRPVYAVSASTTIPTATSNYTSDLWTPNYGVANFNLNAGAQTIEIKPTDSFNQFSLISGGGAMYIESIYVFCAK